MIPSLLLEPSLLPQILHIPFSDNNANAILSPVVSARGIMAYEQKERVVQPAVPSSPVSVTINPKDPLWFFAKLLYLSEPHSLL